jgi:signal transduction histidine kinase
LAAEPVLRRLAASLAHNVNNALTGVIGYLELSLRDVPTDSVLRQRLEGSLSCAYQAANTVQRIVAFALRSKGSQKTARLSLAYLAEEAVDRVRNSQGDSVPRVSIQLESAAWVRGNAALLHEALEQLLANSLEATKGTVVVRVWEENGLCCLSVTDDGPGVPASVMAHLFEPFVTTKTSGHLGLGLVLSREMLEAQGGTLDITSGLEKGTTATLTLPAVDVTTTAPPAQETKVSPGKGWQSEPGHHPRSPVSANLARG